MNPWNDLPHDPPFVLPSEMHAINSSNDRKKSESPRRINTERMPEPRLGPTDAPIIILQMNPSFDTTRQGPLTRAEVQSARRCMLDESHPHPCLASPNPWWDATFKQLRDRYGRKCLSENVCSIEYFPYPSRQFSHGHLSLPSQQYSFNIARAALKRQALIVITRGLDQWTNAVPGLGHALGMGRTVFTTKNRRRPYITENNLVQAGAFKKICAVLDQACNRT